MRAIATRVAPDFLLPCVLLLGLVVMQDPAPARADGGALILREERDGLVVTLLAEPAPLRAGPVRLEVLVQARETGQPVLSGDVRLRLHPPDGGVPLEVGTRPDAASNRLFRAARIDLPTPGPWPLEVQVVGPRGSETFRAELVVAPPPGPARRYASYIAATLLGVALLALHQARSLPRAPNARRGRSRPGCSARRAGCG